MLRARSGVLGGLALASALGGCLGELRDAPAGARAGDLGDDLVPGAIAAATPRRLVLLSPRHYANAVTELLALAPGEIPPPTAAGGSVDGLFAGGTDRLTDALAFELQQLAETAASLASARIDPARDCAGGVADDACAAALIAPLARRAFRREPTAEEHVALRSVFSAGQTSEGDFVGGMRWVIEAILQAPSFLYRRELGVPVAGRDGEYALDGLERATSLAFFLRDSLPDHALLDAAARGELGSAAGIAAQIDRLLDDPEVRARVTALFLRWLELVRIETVVRSDPALTADLRASMAEETTRFVEDLLWEESGTLTELLTSPRAYVDERLAAHYGVAFPAGASGMVAIDLPADRRSGVLSHGSWLTIHADVADTSVVHRGLFVSRQLLCTTIAPPPADAVEDARDDLAALATERERATYRMAHAVCGGCHAQIDPFGLALEGFDGLGRRRAGHDATTTIRLPVSLAGPIDGAPELAGRLAASEEVVECIASQLGGAALGRPLGPAEIATLAPVVREIESSDRALVAFVRAVAMWSALSLRTEAP